MDPNGFRNVRSLFILCADLVAVITIFSWVYYDRLKQFPEYLSTDLWLIASTFIATLYISGTYFKGKSTRLPRFPIHTFFICSIAGIICVFWVYQLGASTFNQYIGQGVLLLGTILFGIVATLIRFAINRLYHRQEEGVELLYLGFSETGYSFFNELVNHSEVRSVSILSDTAPETEFSNVRLLEISKTNEALMRRWDGVIVDPQHHSDQSETSRLISLRLKGTPILTLAEYYEKNWYMVPVLHIGDDWFLRSQGFSMLGNPISLRIKRAIDVLLSVLVIVITIPILILCGLLIKISSKGPVIFQQARVGLEGKIFNIYKLRTMIDKAELNGAQWAQTNDPRVTRLGSFLRKSRLDELPQCWNVLKGEMSFVGPRPERPEFTQELTEKIPYYDLRHTVKPGITGWAQVIFPYGASVDDSLKKLQYELYYIKNQSLLLDFNILLRTIITVFQRAGR